MNGGNTNPSDGQGMMNAAAKELADAKAALTSLIGSKDQNTKLYADYEKIQDTLVKAYDAAEATLNNSASTTQNLKDAETTLQAAISTAASSKQTFNQQNNALVTAYNQLKTAVGNESATLAKVEDAKFARIKENLVTLYNAGKMLTAKPLEGIDGAVLDVDQVTQANTKLQEATNENSLTQQTQNATNLADSFVKQVINKTKITGTTNTEKQPGNYSFVGYSVDLNTITTRTGNNSQTSSSSDNLPSW
ncbi:lipoprotein and hemagglutinin (VlhA) family protein, partial [Mycoplasmoides gallisepticum]